MTQPLTPDRWRRMKRVFFDALDHAAVEREGFVANTCVDDPALRADVLGLLEKHERAGRFPPAPVGLSWDRCQAG